MLTTDMYIAVVFLAVAEKYGFNQKMMAEALGCTQGTISKIYNGEMEPSLKLYMTLLRRFSPEIY